ncbi:MAG: hypothetical protein JWN33_229 [Candidatus Saccharibacteria bacterium]|nr:hypothetical protein [Candidatus Saccharibacteria bacterium]
MSPQQNDFPHLSDDESIFQLTDNDEAAFQQDYSDYLSGSVPEQSTLTSHSNTLTSEQMNESYGVESRGPRERLPLNEATAELNEIGKNVMKMRLHEIDERQVATIVGSAFSPKALLRKVGEMVSPPTLKVSTDAFYNRLVDQESKIGSDVFAEKSRGAVERRFFYENNNEWFFREVSTHNGKSRRITIHYQITPDAIMKNTQDTLDDERVRFGTLGEDETRRLLGAATLYQQRIAKQVYHHKSDYDLTA